RAPAAAQAFAIAQAMLRLFATPNTSPIFPAKTSCVIAQEDTRLYHAANIADRITARCLWGVKICFSILRLTQSPLQRCAFLTSQRCGRWLDSRANDLSIVDDWPITDFDLPDFDCLRAGGKSADCDFVTDGFCRCTPCFVFHCDTNSFGYAASTY